MADVLKITVDYDSLSSYILNFNKTKNYSIPVGTKQNKLSNKLKRERERERERGSENKEIN